MTASELQSLIRVLKGLIDRLAVTGEREDPALHEWIVKLEKEHKHCGELWL